MSRCQKYLLLFVMIISPAVLCLSLPAKAQSNYYNTDKQDDEQPAAAADDDAAPPSHTVMVTSIEKCYAQLDRAETVDIERNFIKPYEECQRRLAIKLKKKQQIKVAPDSKDKAAPAASKEAAAKDAPADAKEEPKDAAPPPAEADFPSGGFYRVQKNPLPAEKSAPKKPATPPAPAAADSNDKPMIIPQKNMIINQ